MRTTNSPTFRHNGSYVSYTEQVQRALSHPISSLAAVIRAPLLDSPDRSLIDKITEGMGFSDREKIARVMKRLAPQKREEIAFEAPKLFEGMDSTSRVSLIEIMAKISILGIPDVVLGAEELAPRTMKSEDRIRIVEALSKVVPDRMPSVVFGAKKLSPEGTNIEDRVRIIEALREISPDKILRVVFGAKELSPQGTNIEDRVRIIEALGEISPDKISSVVFEVKELSPEGTNIEDRVRIIKALGEISPDKISNVVFGVKELRTKATNTKDILRIIEAFEEISADEIPDVTLGVKQLTSEKSEIYYVCSLIKSLGGIPDKKSRDDVVFLSKEVQRTLETENREGRDSFLREAGIEAGALVDAIHQMPLDERADVIVRSIEVWKAAGIGSISYLISEISGVPREARENVIEEALKLIDQETGCLWAASIISTVADLNPAQRSDVVRRAREVIPRQAHPSNISWVVDAISRIPLENRKNVLQQRGEISQSLDQLPDIIESLAKIPTDEERVSVVSLSKGLISNKDINGRYFIVDEIFNVNVNDRSEVSEILSDFIPNHIDNYGRAMIIKAIAEVDSGDRLRVIQEVREVISEQMSGLDIARLITIFSSINPNERNELFRTAREIVPESVGFADTIVIAEALAKVPSNQRSVFIRWALSFVTDQMTDSVKSEKIASLLKGVPVHFVTNFIDIAPSLIPGGWAVSDRFELVILLQSIFGNERINNANRANLIRNMTSLIQSGSVMYKIRIIMELAIKIVDPVQRDALVEMLRPLDSNVVSRIDLCLSTCPEGRLPAILQQFQGQDLSDFTPDEILDVLLKASAVQRAIDLNSKQNPPF